MPDRGTKSQLPAPGTPMLYLSAEYLEAFHDGVAETISQIRQHFDVGLIPEMDTWLDEVCDDLEKPSAGVSVNRSKVEAGG